MDLRELRYFTAIADTGNLTEAADHLHLSQSALTRSLKGLEADLGVLLFERDKRPLKLTEHGIILRARAEELIALADKISAEVHASHELAGDLYICSGETGAFHFVSLVLHQLRQMHPRIRLHIASGDSLDVVEQLDAGLADFGLMFDPIDPGRYECRKLPYEDRWGFLMRKDHPLANIPEVSFSALKEYPLILPRGMRPQTFGGSLYNIPWESVTVAATYSLIYNASLLVEDGVGIAFVLDGILSYPENSPLLFRQIPDIPSMQINLAWRRDRQQSRTAKEFLRLFEMM